MSEQFFDRFKYGYSGFINVLNALLGILLIISILMLARDLISLADRKQDKPPLQARPAAAASARNIQEYAPVVVNNPFGPSGIFKPLAAAANKPGAAADISGLTLVGTVSGARKYSYAIFVDKSNNQEVFRIGDAVRGFGTLYKVEKDKITINRGGTLTEMQLADILSVTEAGDPHAAGKAGAFVKNIGEGSYVVNQMKLHQAIEKPGQIMTDARLLPHAVDGKQQGFTLNEVKQGGIYQSMGLQNGDVLLRINEYNISNPENALQAFTALRGMDRVQLDIIRNGTKMTMNYQIK